MTHGRAIIGTGLSAFLALLAAAFAADQPFANHMWVLFFVLICATIVLIKSFAAA